MSVSQTYLDVLKCGECGMFDRTTVPQTGDSAVAIQRDVEQPTSVNESACACDYGCGGYGAQ